MEIDTYDHRRINVNLPSALNNGNLVAIPSVIDPHVHFRTPGHEHKEDWKTGARAAIAGGVTMVLDMPNNNPQAVSLESLEKKRRIIDSQLKETGIDLHYGLYIGATPDNIDEFEKVKDKVVGIKLFMGASTGNLLVHKLEDQKKIFKRAAELDMLVAVHAEDDGEVKSEKLKVSAQGGSASGGKNPTVFEHSKIHSKNAATKAVFYAIRMTEKFGTRLYICHVSTKEELELVRQAKKRGIKVYAEVTPHHLFLTEDAYVTWGTYVQMNPPLRTQNDVEALWQGINDGTVDTIGTDHAPHTREEKDKPYGQAPSGVPGIETSLPLLLDAYKHGKITLEKIVELTHINPQKIFNLPVTNDWVVIDLSMEKEVQNENLKTKCGWSPFAGRKLRGWPVMIVGNESG